MSEADYIVPSLDPLIASRILAEADSWLGTRYVHQGKLKGLGVDCAQFVAALVRDGAGRSDIEAPENYRRSEDGVLMLEKLGQHGDYVPTDQMQPADFIAFCDEVKREPDRPKHLALVREIVPRTVFIIHASEHGVRRHRINTWWRERIHSIWRLRSE
jgi:cell wall-associated NlpC family hydrolase